MLREGPWLALETELCPVHVKMLVSCLLGYKSWGLTVLLPGGPKPALERHLQQDPLSPWLYNQETEGRWNQAAGLGSAALFVD